MEFNLLSIYFADGKYLISYLHKPMVACFRRNSSDQTTLLEVAVALEDAIGYARETGKHGEGADIGQRNISNGKLWETIKL